MYTYVCLCVYMGVWVFVYLCVYVSVWVFVCICVPVYVCECMCICVYTRAPSPKTESPRKVLIRLVQKGSKYRKITRRLRSTIEILLMVRLANIITRILFNSCTIYK